MPEQVLYLIDRLKHRSSNFEKQGAPDGTTHFQTIGNQAHLFLKLHLWQENDTLSTLTVVDMAGYPSQT